MFHLLPMAVLAAALVGFALVMLLARIPYVGAAIRLGFSLCLIVVLVAVLAERAPMSQFLARFANGFQLDGQQQVVGKEVRIPMSSSGHFVATVSLNGYRRRMMIDTGATVTAVSTDTAEAAGLEPDPVPVPVILQTANGAVQAQTATVPELRLGSIVARDIKVVVSPSFGDLDVLGMNFLSKLASWRVENNTLILVPHHPQAVSNA
ncbi:MAG TPA: TIGR02281 family clan AA aspartic protease [Allosphingosinicella sp.]|nr:TIGR02281 family clan AA aspartic protease [Allosphingosinicella sp.]